MDSLGNDPPSMLTGRPMTKADPTPNSDDADDLVGELPGVVDVSGEAKPESYDALDTKAATVDRVRKRYEEGTGAFEENRRLFSEDLNFIYNAESMGQWDPVVLQARQGKPCYTFNRVIGPVNLVIADMRQTRPAGKVRPSTQGASEATAEVFGGIMRAIEQSSRAETIYNSQYKNAVAGGYGAWYLMPEYLSDKSFDQVLRIKDIPNPLTCVWDPEANDPCCADAMWGMISERISLDKYNSLYPGADASGVSFSWSRDSYGWFTDKEVRVVDYYERVPFKKVIALLSDGSVVDWDAEAKELEAHYAAMALASGTDDNDDEFPRLVRTREVLKWRVLWVKVDGAQVLEGPRYYDWKRIPLVRIPGRYINIEGRKKLQSLIRHAKDAQRSYNSRCSDMIERSALIPKAPYLVTERMVKGYENEWAQANTASRPYLPYNADPNAEGSGGMPIRTPPIDLPSGALALAQMAQADIQATTGFFDPALGNADDMNRVSGKALVQHTRRSDLGSFEFVDGFRAALQLTWEMAIDMIPTIYDTERVERIVGHDDVEKMVTINGSAGDVIHDLSEGSYDVTVTIGPSYQTARQETLQTLIDAAETIPQIAQLCPDLLAKNLDTPEADEMARRLRIGLIQQGIVKPTEQEKKELPPPPAPDPSQQAETQYMQFRAQNEQAKATVQQNKAQNAGLEAHKQAIETAGKHLQNLLMAKELDQPNAAAEAESSQGSAPSRA